MGPSDGRIRLWPVVVIGSLVILASIGITSGVRLKNAAPSDFAALRVSGQRADAEVAAAYWEKAVRVIQFKYTRASGLPEQVPEDFRLQYASGNTAPAAERAAYWNKLREEWLRAENWHTIYSFDLRWLLLDVVSFSRDLGNFVRRT